MSEITLELVANITATQGDPVTASVDVHNHIHKRIERFTYVPSIQDRSVPIAYIENQDLDSWHDLQVVNRTYALSINSPESTGLRAEYQIATGTSYTSVFNYMLITNQVFVDSQGIRRPLFFQHRLPDNVTSCTLRMVENGNRKVVDEGYAIDLMAKALYTNYENYFDPDTGAYRLFYVVCSDGTTETHELLNTQPVVREASWEDVDVNTGVLTTDYPLYTLQTSGGGYTFYFNMGGTWYIKNQERALIQPRLPIGKEPKDAWYLRFTAGEFWTSANSSVRHYWLPEFHTQGFVPAKPYRFSPYESVLLVNDKTLAATRKSLAIDPDSNRHLEFYIYDVDGTLLRVLTTNTALHGTRYSTTSVFYESDQILSWDNTNGIFALGLQLHASWSVSAQYYYEADDYEYASLDLNPLFRTDLKDKTVVFYLIPDTDADDRALHYLIVDESNIIIETSQGPGGLYPNLQLFQADGTVNTSTVIGQTYLSATSPSFYNDYAVHGSNTNAYYILAEVAVLDRALDEDQVVFDVRRDGMTIDPEDWESARRANPRILQSEVGFGEQGMETPKNGVILVSAPISLLEDYGGQLTQDQAIALMKARLHSAVTPVIEWTYPESVLTVDNTPTGQVVLNFTWEGPSQTYRVYRRDLSLQAWTEITSLVSPAQGATTYTDTGVTSGEVYQWGVRIEVGGVLYPFGNYVTAEVA